MPGLSQSEFWHDSRSTFSWDLAQTCCAFTGVSLDKLNGRNRNWESSCSFWKVFQADLFSSCCEMETFGCRAWFRDQRDCTVSHLLNCDESWAIWHRSRTGGLWWVSPGMQLSFCDYSGVITILWCRHAQMLYWEVQYSNLNWTELISSIYDNKVSGHITRLASCHLFWLCYSKFGPSVQGYISVVAQKFTSFLTAKWKGHFSLLYRWLRH